MIYAIISRPVYKLNSYRNHIWKCGVLKNVDMFNSRSDLIWYFIKDSCSIVRTLNIKATLKSSIKR